MTAHEIAEAFFDGYAEALLQRDAGRLSTLYATPALIAFPYRVFSVTDPAQTRQFFDQGWAQYEGVDEVEPVVRVIASTAHSIWADVTWSYGGVPRERYVYQLLENEGNWQVAVLTPLGPDD